MAQNTYSANPKDYIYSGSSTIDINSANTISVASSVLTDIYDTKTTLDTFIEELAESSAVTINQLNNFPVVDLESSSTVYSTSIEANKMYMFGEKETLTITSLVSGVSTIVNEYMFQFTSGNVATTLNVPNTVKWLKEPDIQPNKKYTVSIENNLGIIGEWSNE